METLVGVCCETAKMPDPAVPHCHCPLVTFQPCEAKVTFNAAAQRRVLNVIANIIEYCSEFRYKSSLRLNAAETV